MMDFFLQCLFFLIDELEIIELLTIPITDMRAPQALSSPVHHRRTGTRHFRTTKYLIILLFFFL